MGEVGEGTVKRLKCNPGMEDEGSNSRNGKKRKEKMLFKGHLTELGN